MAVGGNDSLVRMFDTERFAETRLAGSPGGVQQLAFAPDGSRLASITEGQFRSLELAPEGHPALGNFHTSGGLTGAFVVSEDESAATVATYTTDAAAFERVDLATRAIVEVAPGLNGSELSNDGRLVAGSDTNLTEHVLDIASGADLELEPCEVVSGFDRTGRLAIIDRRRPCENVTGDRPPSAKTGTYVLDLRTRRTVLDLGETAVWGGVFGPPTGDGLPGIVAVEAIDGTVTIYDLSAEEAIG